MSLLTSPACILSSCFHHIAWKREVFFNLQRWLCPLVASVCRCGLFNACLILSIVHHTILDLLGGVGVRSNNSTPVGGASGTNQSRKSPLGDKEDNQRTSSRGSGGGSRSQQNDQSRGQRGSGRSNSRGRPRGNNAGGQNAGGRSQSGQGSFNRFASNFNRSNKGPLKFDEDYDFESANVKVSFINLWLKTSLNSILLSCQVWRVEN